MIPEPSPSTWRPICQNFALGSLERRWWVQTHADASSEFSGVHGHPGAIEAHHGWEPYGSEPPSRVCRPSAIAPCGRKNELALRPGPIRPGDCRRLPRSAHPGRHVRRRLVAHAGNRALPAFLRQRMEKPQIEVLEGVWGLGKIAGFRKFRVQALCCFVCYAKRCGDLYVTQAIQPQIQRPILRGPLLVCPDILRPLLDGAVANSQNAGNLGDALTRPA